MRTGNGSDVVQFVPLDYRRSNCARCLVGVKADMSQLIPSRKADCAFNVSFSLPARFLRPVHACRFVCVCM